MTGADHQHSEAVVQAAQWLAEQTVPPSPIVPTLRERFGLSIHEAAEAASLAQQYRVLRRAFG
jgi:hypothetical protein